jgi:hypothetical protein
MAEESPTTYAVGVPDAKGDPTSNVLDLVDAANRRQDDLRKADSHRLTQVAKSELRAVRREIKLRSSYDEKLREAEAKRIDAIRAVDVNAVAVAAERSAQQATVLANQVSASVDTQRGLVATTAQALAEQLQQITTSIIDRLASLEKSQYEGTGKQSVRDPAMDELIKVVGGLANQQSQGTGKSSSNERMVTWIIAAIAVIIAAAAWVTRSG